MIFEDPLLFKKQLPEIFTLLALDMGERKIGLALWFSRASVVVPSATVRRHNLHMDIEAIICIAREYQAQGVVIGLPRHLDGTENELCKKIREFAEHLAKNSQLVITFGDERFSTAIANDMLKQTGMKRKKRAQHDDALAASIILEDFRRQYFE